MVSAPEPPITDLSPELSAFVPRVSAFAPSEVTSLSILETFEKSASTTVAPSSVSSTVSVADPPDIESEEVHSALSIFTVEALVPSLTSTSPESREVKRHL